MKGVFQQPTFPLWFDDEQDVSIATANFDPMLTEAAHDVGKFSHNGYGIKNCTETAGLVRVITVFQYRANRNSVTGIVPRTVRLNGGDWCLTPVVKVFATNDANYPSIGMTYITVGIIL
jgi:hypothetical protein